MQHNTLKKQSKFDYCKREIKLASCSNVRELTLTNPFFFSWNTNMKKAVCFPNDNIIYKPEAHNGRLSIQALWQPLVL